jgi:hypothetical protein
MRGLARVAIGSACALVLAGLPATAAADHASRSATKRLQALGHSPHQASFNDPAATRHVNSDLAFWGRLAFNGNYDGFRVLDLSNPRSPREIAHERCNGDQGDIVVWRNILVRSWNSPAPAGRFCDGQPVPAGFEGVHVFDIGNPASPVLRAAVPLECGSHTATIAGVSGGRLIVWSNNSSSTTCVDGTRPRDDPAGDFMDVIGIPLDAPQNAALLRRQPLEGPNDNIRTGCHDAGVIRGRVNKGACANADTINVWDIGRNRTAGGSPQFPQLLYTLREPGVGQAETNGRWHSAAFTWDGEVLIAGWEPGGGSEAECEGTDPAVEKSLFFYDADTGKKLGQWVLPRGQLSSENCTVHNYNILPLRNGRYVAVSGNYQAGTWVTDFTNPRRPRTLAYSDPEPLEPPFAACDPDAAGPAAPECQLGGAWATYWYNGFVYESDITQGVNVFRINHRRTRPAVRLSRLNPQTQDFSMKRRRPGR